ncbi:hypothetical protein B0H12DRAFT_1064017 [Mycena haematopus]|nr:hypothetical protein B0H12DRAFT_1064017 [Mycena haematopus]
MDAPLHPPLRVDAVSRTPLSSKNTQRRLEKFLQDFGDRTTASQGGHSAVTVQVQKLQDALRDEREAVKVLSK